MKPKARAGAKPVAEKGPGGIFDEMGALLNNMPASAAEPANGAPASGMWARAEEEVAAQPLAPVDGQASLWDNLNEQLRLIKSRPKLRDDLVTSQIEEAGVQYRVVKDPVAETYFRFKENEYFILTLLDGHNEVRDIVRLYTQQYRPIRPETVQNFLDKVEGFGLLVRGQPNLYERLFSGPLAAPAAVLSSALRFCYTVPDTDEFTQRLYHKLSFVFWPAAIWFWSALALSGLALLVLGWSRFMSTVLEVLGGGWALVAYAVALYTSIIVIIVIHELAHALTCVHYGGHVHKMGVMLYYISLVAFADTSDAWLFASPRRRAWVSLAGPLSTLVCSAIALWVWQFSASGSSHGHVAATLVLSTIPLSFANLNPLMEYDGYYVLTDLTGIPNLRKRSFAYCRAFLRRLWQPETKLPDVAPARPRIFIGYGVLATAYFVFLMIVPLAHLAAYLVRQCGPLAGGLLALGLVLLFWQRFIRSLWERRRAKKVGSVP